jgi:nucleoside-diphosphate-sugar epimerase
MAEALGLRVVVNDVRARGLRVPVRGEIRAGDLRDSDFVRRLPRGCDYVVHTAAQLDAGAKYEELAATNTDVVVRLFEAAEAASVRRFVHMSTAMLYARGQRGPLVEDAEVAPRGAHGMSKHGAEAYLRGRRDSIDWTILRAAPVYGRRGRHFAASLLAIGPMLSLALPWLPRFAGGPLGTMAHAEDVASALLFVLHDERARFEVFNVASEGPLPLGDRVSQTFDAYGLRSVPVPDIPRPVGAFIGRLFGRGGAHAVADVLSRRTWQLVVARYGLKPALQPRLDREGLTLLDEDLVVDCEKLRALGWKPRFGDFGRGFREVLRWYQAEAWVPRFG